MSRYLKVILCLFVCLTFSKQQCLQANESVVTLLPSLNGRSNASSANGRLNAHSFTSNAKGKFNVWRTGVTSASNGSLNIDLKTGNWPKKKSKLMDSVWISPNQDWAPFTAQGKTITYSFTFGESTIGISSSFRLTASKASRGAGHLADCALILNYGERECTVSLNGKSSTGKLSDPIAQGTTVLITLHPNKTMDIKIDETWVMADQELVFDENYIVISASSEARSDPTDPRQLVLKNLRVDVR
jgi:hypothetical protein